MKTLKRSLATSVLLIAVGYAAVADSDGDAAKQSPPNVKSPTLGGTQFWTDLIVLPEMRIQQHALTNHCRLLDGDDARLAWGTFEHCESELRRRITANELPPVRGKVIIVLHGIVGFRSIMEGLCEHLEEHTDCTVLNVAYASTRAGLDTHAAALKSVIDHLPEATEINFVAHSMGNLVVRRYLADHTDAEKGQKPDPRINRICMLAPPNNGARMAEMFKNVGLFKLLLGRSGEAMADAEQLQEQLAVPHCEFAIIAGGRSNDIGYSPLLKGDDDLVVAVSETRLPGARDFIIVPSIHRLVMNQPKTKEYAVRFLKHGYFISEEERQPIAPVEQAEAIEQGRTR